MKKNKAILPVLALMLCLGAFLFPATAYAQAGDETSPTLTAALSGEILTVVAKDDTSVAAIYIGEYRFSTLIDGTARVRFSDYTDTDDKQAEVYAVDSAGNRSESVFIDNPQYIAPVPTPTPAPTPTPTPSPTPEPTPSAPTEEAIPDPNAFTPDGGGTVQDNATDEDGKEFFTVTTAAGNVYYLIIDRQRGTENVYFLSPVTEADLLGLAEGLTTTEPGLSQPEPQTPAPATSTPEPTQPQPEQPDQSNGPGVGMIIFIALAAAAIGAVGYYVKIVKPRQEAGQREEYEYEDESEEEDGATEYFFEDESDDTAEDEEETDHAKN